MEGRANKVLSILLVKIRVMLADDHDSELNSGRTTIGKYWSTNIESIEVQIVNVLK